uniref:Uncharacterized protein n=1 Tax=Ixodes ricinus TaxID=34613 RepID=A0A6B0U526_IXORI
MLMTATSSLGCLIGERATSWVSLLLKSWRLSACLNFRNSCCPLLKAGMPVDCRSPWPAAHQSILKVELFVALFLCIFVLKRLVKADRLERVLRGIAL